MAKARTEESGVPLYKKAQRAIGRGRGADIDLPMPEGGKRDPRLPPDPRATARDVISGFKAVRKLTRGRRSNGR